MSTINENTGIKLGIILTCVAIAGGILITIAGGIWWASGLTSDVRNVQALLLNLTTTSTKNGSDIEELKRRMTTIEAAGSPKTITLEKDVQDIRRMMEVHINKAP